MTSDYLRLLFDYHYWANRRVWNCIAQLTPEQFTQHLNYSIGSIRNQVVHMMSAERAWFLRITGTSSIKVLDPEQYPTTDSVLTAWRDLEAQIRAYAAALTDDQLERTFAYFTFAGDPFENKVGDILFHVLNHATDHRAQVLAMMNTNFGVNTDAQDLILYVREQG